MALKRTITKDDFAKLSDGIKEQYIESGDGYRLDIDGDDDNGALKRAKDREVQLRKDAEERARLAQEKLDEISGTDAKKRGDIDALEKSWTEKNKKLSDESAAQIQKLKASTEKHLRDGNARALAAKISNAPDLLYPHIVSRLTVDYEGEEPKLRILDDKGQPSAMTLDELSAEFVANKNYSAIMIASKSSGGGGGGTQQQPGNRGNNNGGAGNKSGNGKGNNQGGVDYSTMSREEKLAYMKEVHAARNAKT